MPPLKKGAAEQLPPKKEVMDAPSPLMMLEEIIIHLRIHYNLFQDNAMIRLHQKVFIMAFKKMLKVGRTTYFFVFVSSD